MRGQLQKSHTFTGLDGLRGIAALAVVCYHQHNLFGKELFPHGYLAVDFFFLLSSFVLCHAYQGKLDGGMPTSVFLRLRISRLYPLYLLALLLAIPFRTIQVHAGVVAATAGGMVVLSAFAALFLPLPPQLLGAGTFLFPLNPPSWSLFDELAANALHAIALRRRSTPLLQGVLVVTGMILVFIVYRNGSLNLGVDQGQLLLGLARIVFSYLAGILVYRWWASGEWRLPTLHPILSALILSAALAVPVFVRYNVLYELTVAIVLFPILLFTGASAIPSPSIAAVCRSLGKVSYAIYVLQTPLQGYFDRAWVHLFHRRMVADAPWSGVANLCVTVLTCFAADTLFDLRARAWLRRVLLPAAH